MPDRLEQCEDPAAPRLRQSADGTFLCLAECEGGNCCTSAAPGPLYPGLTEQNVCNSATGLASACLTQLERVNHTRWTRQSTRTTSFAGTALGPLDVNLTIGHVYPVVACPPGTPGTTGGLLSFSESIDQTNNTQVTESLNGENYGTGNCAVRWNVPIRTITAATYTTNDRWNNQFPGFPGCSSAGANIDQRGTGSQIESCLSAVLSCPPIGQHSMQTGEFLPIAAIVDDPVTDWGGLAPVWGTFDNTTTQTSRPGYQSFFLRERIFGSSSLVWTGSRQRLKLELRITRTREVATNYRRVTALGGADGGTRTEVFEESFSETTDRTITVEGKLAWFNNCDGTTGPTGCPPVVTDCEPNLLYFIVGEPCGGVAPRPVVLPAFLVPECGYLNVGGICFRFRPGGVKITDPAGFNAIVADQLITPYGPKSCCECGTSCPHVTIQPRPEWLNGSRNEVSGAWSTSPAFVAGNCCCFPDDRFRVAEAWSTFARFLDNPANELLDVERYDMVVPPDPSPNFSNFVAGFRRDAVNLEYGLRYRLTDSEGTPGVVYSENSIQKVQVFGPVGCEYNAFGASGGVAQYSFTRPLDADGMSPRNVGGAPIPSDVPADGQGPSNWRINRYTIAVTCQGLTAEAEWVQRYPSGRIQFRVRAKHVWIVTPSASPSGPCAGGCPPPGSTPPIAGTTGGPGTLTPIGGLPGGASDPFALAGGTGGLAGFGGCAGCGGDGGVVI